MNRVTKIIVISISIVLIALYTITSTYSVIVEVTEKDGIVEIVNEISIKDLLTNDDGTYNNIYYMLKDELNASDAEANQLMNSEVLNTSLKVVLESIVDYKINDNIDAKFTDQELYDLIAQSVLDDDNLSDDLKSRVINKASIYKNDVSDYIYDIEVSKLGGSK